MVRYFALHGGRYGTRGYLLLAHPVEFVLSRLTDFSSTTYTSATQLRKLKCAREPAAAPDILHVPPGATGRSCWLEIRSNSYRLLQLLLQ